MIPKYDAEIVKSNMEILIDSLNALAENKQAQKIVDDAWKDIHIIIGTAKMMVRNIAMVLDPVFVAIERSNT